MITGYDVGTHFIVPAAFMSPNFLVTYTLSNLEIEPTILKVTATDKGKTFAGAFPLFTSVLSGFRYDDDSASVISGPVTYRIYNSSNVLVYNTANPPPVPPALPEGTYSIVPKHTVDTAFKLYYEYYTWYINCWTANSVRGC
jgi:hypothetical protein